MFETEILSKVFDLKEMLVNCNEYKLVKLKEKEMEEQCASLLIEYNRLFQEYNDALRFKNYGSNVEEAQKKLHLCKNKLDNNDYVKEYRKAYKDLENLLKEVEKLVFAGIIDKRNLSI